MTSHVEARRVDAHGGLARCKQAEIALTGHLVIPDGPPDDVFLQDATHGLHDRFEIEGVTLQVVKVPFCQPCDSAFAATAEPVQP